MYTEKDLVTIAKRENNIKRKYLVVNKLQGKHIPVSPNQAFEMFEELADIVGKEYGNETLLLIGFAETATAIGTSLAVKLDSWYMQTTREDIKDVEYLYFSEAHSHATEQKLIKTDLDKIIRDIDRIIFVEDEVTTGNTILNIINIIEKVYAKKIHFSVVSLLNGMNKEAEKIYDDRQINLHYLLKVSHDTYTETAEGYRGDGKYYPADVRDYLEVQNKNLTCSILTASGYENVRRLNRGKDILTACENLYDEIRAGIEPEREMHILVLGTEEFMYPALFLAGKLERQGNHVRCHSTTRSPIAVSTEKEYPLHERYELVSMYDRERVTYLYDIGQYDEVIIITDSENPEREGVSSLINSLCLCGNENISFVRWC